LAGADPPIDEAGRAWELRVWGGIWPAWYKPKLPVQAEQLAKNIIENVIMTNELQCPPSEMILKRVGSRYNPNSSISGAADVMFASSLFD
jgi:hypothetical protein